MKQKLKWKFISMNKNHEKKSLFMTVTALKFLSDLLELVRVVCK